MDSPDFRPLDYATPPPPAKPLLRKVFGRVVVAAWIVVAGAFAFSIANASDRSRFQWPAAIFFVLALLFAVFVTLVHWCIIVPLLWLTGRKTPDGT